MNNQQYTPITKEDLSYELWEEVTCVNVIGTNTIHIIEFVTPNNDFGIFNKFQTPVNFEVHQLQDGKVVTIQYDMSGKPDLKKNLIEHISKVFQFNLSHDLYLNTPTNKYFYKGCYITE